jgi:hypothetical protein
MVFSGGTLDMVLFEQNIGILRFAQNDASMVSESEPHILRLRCAQDDTFEAE